MLPQNALSLTLILLMWKIWLAPNNASRWQVGFNLTFKGLRSLEDLEDGLSVGEAATTSQVR